MLSGTPPTVEDVLISGQAWRDAFVARLSADNEGDGGYRLTALSTAAPLPWSNLDRLSVRFSESVEVHSEDLWIQGVNAGVALPLAANGFQYDAATYTATWTLTEPLAADKYAIRIGDGITNMMGVALDGAGGDHVIEFSAVPGDGNQDGVTDELDGDGVRERMFANTASANYSTRFDFDGSGAINVLDGLGFRDKLDSELPAGQLDLLGPVMIAALANDTAPAGLTNDDGITFDATIAGSVFDAAGISSLAAVVDGGQPIPVAVNADGTFNFDPAAALRELADGPHTVRMVARDVFGNPGSFDVAFTLDRLGPLAPALQLSAGSGVVAPGTSNAARVMLVGSTDPNISVRLVESDTVALSSTSGGFQFPSVPLVLGENVFTTVATDLAGNTVQSQVTVERVDQAGELDPVLRWNQVLLEAVRLDGSAPTFASRAMAMVHVAIYDAVAAIEGTPGYFVALASPAEASLEAAVSGAAHSVLSYAYPGQQAAVDAALSAALAQVPAGAAKDDGVAFGRTIGEAVVALRDVDGWDDFVDVNLPSDPGVWQATTPMYAEALAPQWADLEPFAMSASDQFRPAGPPSLLSQTWADAVADVELLGRADSATRTAEQTQIARFWSDGPGTITPPGHWNQIAQEAASQGNSLAENARLFVQLNLALADAAIIAWDAKYTYNFWRPVTAIQQADFDGNDLTISDPTWLPLLITPPFPDYVSGHSTFSGAAAAILSEHFGENFSFTTTSPGLAGVSRTFDSFAEAAEEAGRSRIYAGIHYEFANQDGLAAGRALAEHVLGTFSITEDLQPPRIVVTSHESGLITAQNSALSGRVLDNLAGVVSLEHQLDDGAFAPAAFDTTGQFSIPVNLPGDGTADGQHVLRLRATDAVGNVAAPVEFAFTLDTTAPTVVIDAPLDGAAVGAGALLQGTVSGTGSAVVQLSYTIEGGQPTPVPFAADSGEFSAPLDLSQLAAGQHSLTLTARDAAGNTATATRSFNLEQAIPLTVVKHLPLSGGVDVGSTFKPQVFFSRPIDPDSLTSSNFFATDAAGQPLAARIVPADDGTFAWLFFEQPMPGSSRITVHLNGSSIRAAGDGALLDADGDGVPGGMLEFSFTTVSLTPLVGTTLSGKVVDPGPDFKPMTFDDLRAGPDQILHTADDVFLNPIAGVKVYILGLDDEFVITDADGNFHFDRAPSGNVKLVVDGQTATNAPAGFYFPEMVMDLTLEAGRANTVMGTMGALEIRAANRERQELYLPRLHTSLLRDVNAAETTMIGVDAESAPNLSPEQRALLTIEVQPGSLIDASGNPLSAGQIGISTVPPELVREMLPPGLLQHTFDITVQAPGIANFSTPAPMTFPNLFGAAPGTQLNFLSFDHTTGRLVIEGAATVSPDGLSVSTDPGTGITHPGWHGLTPQGGPAGPNAPGAAAIAVTVQPVVPKLTGVMDYLFHDNSRGTLIFENAAEKSAASSTASFMQVRITVDQETSQKYLDGLRTQQFNLRAGEKKEIQFAFKRMDIAKLESDVLIGAKYTVEMWQVDPGGALSQLINPSTYYVYRYVDAMDSNSSDGKLEFSDTFNDGSGAVTRDRFIPYLGDPTAQPTLNIVTTGSVDFYGVNEVGQFQISFDPLRTQDNIEASIQVLTPGPDSREVKMPGTLRAIGNGVGPEVIFLNKAEFIQTLHDLAYDASPMKVVLEYNSSLLTSPSSKFFQLSLPDDPTPNKTINLPLGATQDFVENALRALPSIGPEGVSVLLEHVDVGAGPGGTRKIRATYTITPRNDFANRATPTFEVIGVNTGSALTWTVTRQARVGVLTQDQKDFLQQPGKIESMFDEIVKRLNEKYLALTPAITFSEEGASSFGGYALHWSIEVPPNGETAHFEAQAFDGLVAYFAEISKKGTKVNNNQAAFRIADILSTARRDPDLDHSGVVFVQELFDPRTIGRANASEEDLVTLIANLAAHETGHGLGLPHVAFAENHGPSELQLITVKPGSSSFSLTYAGATTSELAANSTAKQVEDALLTLPGLQGTRFQVTGANGGPYTINFDPAPSVKPRSIFAGVDVPQITGVNVDWRTLTEGKDVTAWLREVVINGQRGRDDLMQSTTTIESVSFLSSISEILLRMSLGTRWEGSDAKLARSLLAAAVQIKAFAITRPQVPGEDRLADPDDFIYDGPGLAVFNPDGLLADQQPLDFGTVPVGGGDPPSTRRLTIVNFGGQEVVVRSVGVTQGYDRFSISPVPATRLLPGESLEIEVTFNPLLNVPSTGLLVVDSDIEVLGGDVQLLGSGGLTNEPAIRVDFYNNLQGAEIGQLTSFTNKPSIVNEGTAPLTVTEIRVASGQGEDEYFVQHIQTLPVTLQPGESFIFNHNFQPSRAGLRPGAFEIVSDDPDTPVFRLPVVGTGVTTTDNFITFQGVDLGNDFVAVEANFLNLFDNLPVLRTRSDDGGNWEFFLPSRTSMHVVTFDPVSGLIAHGGGLTGAAGERTNFNIGTFRPSVHPDTDGDGLPDDVELAIGTSPNNPDTDGDGINDFAELDAGQNPLDDRPTASGVVSALTVGGEARGVILAADFADPARKLAYLAATSAGVAIVDVTDFARPVMVGQINVPGSIDNLALDVERKLLAAASPVGGVSIIDVANATRPMLIHTVPHEGTEPVAGVEMFDGLMFVGVGGEIRSFEARTGEAVETFALGNQRVMGMSRSGDRLFVTLLDLPTNQRMLRLVDIAATGLVDVNAVALPNTTTVGDPFVADGIAWIPATDRIVTVDVSAPEQLQVIAGTQGLDQVFVGAISLNGSGLGVVAGGIQPDGSAIIFETPNPQTVDQIFTRFTLPSLGEDVALSAGLAYVADGLGGLQLVNFLQFDQGTTPPSILIDPVPGDIDPGRPGLQIPETATVLIPARVTDDVQVRNVELLVDGVVVRNELSYPYDLSTVLPRIADTGTEVVLQVRATDTGGNVRLSDPIVIELVPDVTPPAIVSIDPPDGSTQQILRRRVSVQFSEPLDPTTAVAANFVLRGPAGDVTPISLDLRQRGTRVEILYPPLAAGNYELVIHAAEVTDRAGNALSDADITSTFRIASVTREPTIRWVNDAGGNWNDANNWIDVVTQSPRLPTGGDDVLIDVPGDALVTLGTGVVEVNSVISNERFQITGGRLTLTETIQVNNDFLLRGPNAQTVATLSGTILRGTGGEGITIAGHSRLDAATIQTDVTMNEAGTRLRLANGLALLGTATVSTFDAYIGFEGGQQITSGTFVSMGAAPLDAVVRMEAIGTANVTFGKDVTVRGHVVIGNGSQFPSATPSALHLINMGTLAGAGGSGYRLQTSGESMINHGLIAGEAQTSLLLNDKTWTNAADGRITVTQTPAFNFIQAQLGTGATTSWTNAGTIELVDTFARFMTSSVGLNETWSNTGTLLVERSILQLFGQFTSDDVVNVRNTGAVAIFGQMDNIGRTFTFNDQTGSYTLAGGRILGGTLVMTGPNSRLEFAGSPNVGTLDGVTIEGDIVFGGRRDTFQGSFIISGVASVINGLTLNGTVTIYDSQVNVIEFNGPQTVSGATFQFLVDPDSPGTSIPNGIQAFGGGPVVFDSSVTIRGASGRGLTGNIISHANIVIDPGSSIELGGINHINPNFAGPFINRGTITVPASTTAILRWPFVNEGEIIVNQGTVRASVPNNSFDQPIAIWRNSGVIDLTNQGRLEFTTLTGSQQPRLHTADLGTILDSGGFVSLEGNMLLNNSEATLVIDGTADWSLGNGVIEGGTIQVADTARFHAGSALKDLTVEGNVGARNGLRLVGELTFLGNVAFESPNGSFFAGFGDPIRYPNLPTVIHQGMLDFRSLIDAGSGTVTLEPGVVLRGRNLQATHTGALTNRGQIVADASNQFASGEVFHFTAAPVTNFGTLAAVNRSILRIANLAAPNEGIVSAAAGSRVEFTNDFAQTGGATMSVEAGGTAANQVGRVAVGGAATLAGTLDVQFIGGFTPVAGDRFEVLSYASRIGQFDAIQVANLSNGLVVAPEYNETNMTLVVSASLPLVGERTFAVAPRPLSIDQQNAYLAAAIGNWAESRTDEDRLVARHRPLARTAYVPEIVLGEIARERALVDRGIASRGRSLKRMLREVDDFVTTHDHAVVALTDETPASRLVFRPDQRYEMGSHADSARFNAVDELLAAGSWSDSSSKFV